MKKQYLLMAAFASALAFTACTNDDAPFTAPGEGEGSITEEKVVEGATFEIAIAGAANGNTKVARPMGSSAADNNVNAIKLDIYKFNPAAGTNKWEEVTIADTEAGATGGAVALKYVSGEANQNKDDILKDGIIDYSGNKMDVTEGIPGTDQHINKRAKIEVIGLESGVKYQIVAIGYNGTAKAYPYNSTTGYTAAGEGFANGVSLANVGSVNDFGGMQEIFAATSTADTYTNADGDEEFTVTPSLTLKRQVAGILAYFEKIPMYLPKQDGADNNTLYRVEKLEVVANQTATDFYFPAILLDNPDFNGVVATEDLEDVLMKFEFATAHNYPTDETITADKVANGQNEFYTFGENGNGNLYATSYESAKPSDLQLLPNTAFGARYILPYDKHYGESTTLTLVFKTKNDEVLLVRDVTTDQPGFASNTYDIRCNNFYSIGQKLKTDGTDGPDTDDDDDDDDPISLNGNTVNLRINDAWDVLHNMGVE